MLATKGPQRAPTHATGRRVGWWAHKVLHTAAHPASPGGVAPSVGYQGPPTRPSARCRAAGGAVGTQSAARWGTPSKPRQGSAQCWLPRAPNVPQHALPGNKWCSGRAGRRTLWHTQQALVAPSASHQGPLACPSARCRATGGVVGTQSVARWGTPNRPRPSGAQCWLLGALGVPQHALPGNKWGSRHTKCCAPRHTQQAPAR